MPRTNFSKLVWGNIMARSRQIKPGFFLNEDLAKLVPFARLLFIGLWLLADREGRLEDRPARIKAEIFPYEAVDIDALLASLDQKFIKRYEVAGVPYIMIIKFKRHQHIHPDEKQSSFPAFSTEAIKSPGISGDFKKAPEIMPCSCSCSCSPSPSSSLSPLGASNAPQNRPRKTFVQPTLAEVTAYCQERRNNVNPRKWLDHYTSNGWRVGRNPMKDWKAAVRTWEQSDISGASKTDDEFGRRGREITERIQREQREAGNA